MEDWKVAKTVASKAKSAQKSAREEVQLSPTVSDEATALKSQFEKEGLIVLPATPTQTITSTQPVATQIQPSTTTPFQPSTTTPFQPSTATPFQPSTLAQFQPSALAQFQSSPVFNTPPGHIPIGAVYGNYNSPNHPSSETSWSGGMNLYRHSSFTGEDAMELGRSSTPSSSSGDYQNLWGEIRKLRNQMDQVRSVLKLKKKLKAKTSSESACYPPTPTDSPLEMDTSGTKGCWLGERGTGQSTFIESLYQEDIARAENDGTTPAKLAVNLLCALFSQEDISTGNCTQPRKPGIMLLDQKKMCGIRYHVNYRFPCAKQDEPRRWNNLLTKNLNAKCRSKRLPQDS
ncbi:uncharacterized protein LOC135348995 isoform X2 [Halichondria panicea]|uniref:uncharacterized protein LOC135348995 isoform X2 n=1 Tax=Halichondria panicea TaxID=6063 RepID=UPI00312B61F1